MKSLTVFGTRPEIIRLSRIIPLLDEHCEQILVHTGQNYDPSLSQMFLDELKIRPLDHHLGVQSSSFCEQAGQILAKTDALLDRVKPDRLLILGDTNSGLAAVVAARRGIAVYHLEAGNRCYDNRVPEEVNRRIIDHSSDVLLPYTHRSAANLVAEGIRRERIFVVGNPILEVLEHFVHPRDEFSRIGELGAEYIITSTEIHPGERPSPDWPYLSPASGQHVAFYRPETLRHLGAACGYPVVLVGPYFQIFSRRPFPSWRWRAAVRWGEPLHLLIRRLRPSLTVQDSEAQRRRLEAGEE